MYQNLNPASEPAPRAPRFDLGRVVATPAALALLEEHNCSPLSLLVRHGQGDWGDALPPEDAFLNDQAVIHGGRILSSYRLGAAERIWIITDQSPAVGNVTTVLRPEDY